MEKRWSKADIAYLKQHAGDQRPEDLAQRFRVDAEAVKLKLKELDLAPGGGSDAALQQYGEGLGLLHSGKWEQAAELFEQTIAAAAGLQLADRARQNLEVCRRNTAQSPAGEDPYLQAVFEKNQGNLDGALELCLDQGEVDEDERYAYLAASIKALAGAEDEALDHLADAIRLEPKNRVHAFHDPDFKSLHGEESFSSLVAVGGSADS